MIRVNQNQRLANFNRKRSASGSPVYILYILLIYVELYNILCDEFHIHFNLHMFCMLTTPIKFAMIISTQMMRMQLAGRLDTKVDLGKLELSLNGQTMKSQFLWTKLRVNLRVQIFLNVTTILRKTVITAKMFCSIVTRVSISVIREFEPAIWEFFSDF